MASTRSLFLDEVVTRAFDIYAAHEEGAAADAGFDSGEFSGPAHSRMADDEVEKLARENGYYLEDVINGMNERAAADAGPYGYIS